jgi:GxxExxY protein
MEASRLIHRELSERVIGAFYATYRELGFGFLESVYEAAFALQLTESGLLVERQHPIVVRLHYSFVAPSVSIRVHPWLKTKCSRRR